MQELKISPKTIMFTAVVCNIIFVCTYLYFYFQFDQIYKESAAQAPPLFHWSFFVPIILMIININYWLYLRQKERKKENVKFALLLSVVLFLVTFYIVPNLIISQLMIPLYSLPSL